MLNFFAPLLLVFGFYAFSATFCFAGFKFRSIDSALKVGGGACFNVRNLLTYTTGTLEVTTPSATSLLGSSNSITFSNALFKSGPNVCFLSANLDPTSVETINLPNGGFLFCETITTLFQPVSVAAAATATIAGSILFANTINLSSSTSVLQLNLSNTLTETISGPGTLSLLDDLVLGNGVGLPSNLNLGNNCLTMLGGMYTQALTISGGGTLVLRDTTNIYGLWTIGASGENYTIAGSGGVLDLGLTGTIIFNGATLSISNLVIKGLATNLFCGTGEIKLSNVTLILAGDYIRSDGSVSIVGSNCKIVTNGYNFVMSGASNNLKVDGTFLFYEELNSAIQNSPISVTNGAAITLLNGGNIISIGGGGVPGVGNMSMTITTTYEALMCDYPITAAGLFQVNNATPAASLAVAIDGGGHFLSFPQKSGSYFILQNNVQLTLSDILLKDFYPGAISLGTSSTIVFGNNTRIEMGQDLTLDTTSMAWAFTGNAEIDGNGATLNINQSGGITIAGGNTLTIKNMRIVVSVADGIKALSASDHIKMQDVVFVLQSAGFAFSTGNLDISNFVKLTGNLGAAVGQSIFTFSSTGYLTILSNAELFVDKNINFVYNANPTNDLTTYASKRHFLFGQQTSALTLFGCSLQSTATGLALDMGTLNILDHVTLNPSTSVGAAFEFGPNLQTNMGTGAVLDILGPVRYREA